MAANWLTYNPSKGYPIGVIQNLARDFEADPANATIWWRIPSLRTARKGNWVYLFKQGKGPRGIFGISQIIDEPEIKVIPSDDLRPRPRAHIRFERLVDPSTGFLLRLEDINGFVTSTLINAHQSGIRVAADIASEIDKRLQPSLASPVPPLDSDQADSDEFDPDSAADTRERALRAIRIRRGQPTFRSALLDAYGRRCAVTGCSIVNVLEAAHIAPYLGPLTNDVSNGLLLRSDLHTLFDCYLLSVHPQTRRVVIAEELKVSSYAKLADRKLRAPVNDMLGPSTKALSKRYTTFEAQQKKASPRDI
jgi:putative restriction endonuclease